MADDTARDPEYRPVPGGPHARQAGHWPSPALVGGGDGEPGASGPVETGTTDGTMDAGEDGPEWTRPRSRRARAWRLGLTLAVLALALAVVVEGPLSQLLLAPRPSTPRVTRIAPGLTGPHLDSTGWAPAPVPRGTQDVRTIDVRPSPTDANVGYACWLAGGLGPAPEPLRISVSVDGERSWQTAKAPALAASACQLIPDAAAASHVVALVDTAAITDTCASSAAYASADGAQTWSAIAWPSALRGACDAWRAIFSLNGRLFVWSPYYQQTSPRAPGALLYRSDDNGRTWQVVDPAPGDDTVAVVAGHVDGSVLVFANPIPGAVTGSTPLPRLWSSPDGGTTWTALGTTPAGTSLVYASGEPTPPVDGGWGTVYAVALPPDMEANAPVSPVAIDMSTASGWQAVRPLPEPDALPSQPLGLDGGILGVGPGGVLLVTVVYTADTSGINNGLLAPPHMIWGWDPGTRAWLPDYDIVPSNTEVEGFSWARPPGGAERIVILVFTINAGLPPFTGLFRATVVAPKASGGVGGLGGSR